MSDAELFDISEEKSEDLRDRQIMLRTLIKHPAWDILVRCASFQMVQYQRQALRPIKTMDEVPNAEYVKGVAQGIQEVLSIPEQVLTELETELAAREARVPQTDGDGDDEELVAGDDGAQRT